MSAEMYEVPGDRLRELTESATQPVRFRPGQGGEMSPEWAAYMLNLWWAARDSKMTFATAVTKAASHFMVGEQ